MDLGAGVGILSRKLCLGFDILEGCMNGGRVVGWDLEGWKDLEEEGKAWQRKE